MIGWDQNTFKKELEEQKVFVVKADTIAELAKKMGLPADNWKQPSNATIQFVKNGKDEDFGRKYMKGTFEKGPFYGFIGQPIAGISLGGLKVNKDLRYLMFMTSRSNTFTQLVKPSAVSTAALTSAATQSVPA